MSGEMKKEEQVINKFDAAFVKTQLQIKNPQFDCNVDFQPKDKPFRVKYSYASLNEVLKVIREAANPNGIYITQSPQILNNQLVLVTRIAHESGEFRESIFPLSIDLSKEWKDKGSAITYARRYVLCSLFGIFGADDDDGIESDDRFASAIDQRKEVENLIKEMNIAQQIEFWRLAGVKSLDKIADDKLGLAIRIATGLVNGSLK